MAMGGAGVAVGDPSTAPFFNPALLSASDASKKYSVELPIIGVRLYDPANMRSELNTLSSNITSMNNSISSAQAATNEPALRAALTNVVTNVNQVNASFNKLNNQPLQGEFGAATVIGIPGPHTGMAFYANAYAAVGGTLEFNDSQQLTTYANNITTALNGGTPTVPTPISLTSKLHLRGVTISEAGLSISHGFTKKTDGNSDWSLGITPKIMQLNLFDARLDPSNNNTSNATGNDYLATYSTLNLDVGAAKVYANGWRSGAVIKNLIPQSFDFKSAPTTGATPVANGSTLSLKPQVRVGVSHDNTWSTVAIDLDLTQNDPAGLEQKSQYLALGGELSAWGWAQIRAGYRADLVNSARSVASLGLGISPRIPYFKVHTDLAVAGNANEVGASLRFGVNF
jgi:hypothetical protein